MPGRPNRSESGGTAGEKGHSEESDVEVLGTSFKSIERAEDRELFKELCQGLGEPVPPSEIAETLEDGLRAAAEIGYPVVLRPAFTLGGTGGGFADDEEECRVMHEKRLGPVTGAPGAGGKEH